MYLAEVNQRRLILPEGSESMSCGSCGGISPSQAQQASLGFQVQIAVQAKQLSAQKQQGEAAIALLDSALQLAKGKTPGQGEQLDVTG